MKPPFRLKVGLVFILLIVIFLVLNLTGFSKEVKNFFYLISSPVQKTFWQAGEQISDFWQGLFEINVLQKEITELSLENQRLLSENVGLKVLKEENETLRQALGIGLEKDFQIIFCQNISKDIFQDSILIDKGAEKGVLKGMPVITSQKALIGRIGEVYKDFSEVILITNKESSFDAKIFERDVSGVVKGRGDSKLELTLISKDKEISQGDFVVTAVFGGIFPKGLLVGSIQEIEKLDIEPFQVAEINPSVDFKKLDNLFIIIDF